MSGPVERVSLVNQVCASLRADIAKQTWSVWLPGERWLCRSLQISRNTLRMALQVLAGEGLVRSEHGVGTRIIGIAGTPSSAPVERTTEVGLLAPQPMELMRPTQAMWITELMTLLGDRGIRLRVFSGRQFYEGAANRNLIRLTEQHPMANWVLVQSTETMQRWFFKRGYPAIVAGSRFPDIALPAVDLDHRALCRHAAGTLLAAGHRRLALLIGATGRQGDLDSEEGFLDGVEGSSHQDATVRVKRHDESVRSVTRGLAGLMKQKDPPTGLLVAWPNHYLTVTSWLTHAGYRIPEDISVICRDDDPFLAYLVPEPSRYVASWRTIAAKILRWVSVELDGLADPGRAVSIMPRFVRGGTVRRL